jgi:hypothetical protein
MNSEILVGVVGLSCLAGAAAGQTLDPFYECAYRFASLGSPSGVPSPLGGLVFKAGDPHTLLIGGSANQAGAKLYAIPVVRDAEGHITGFGGAAEYFADAPNVDGGLCYGPDGVLFFSRYSMNEVGQLKPGSTVPDRTIQLTPLGFTPSVGAFTFVPPGFPGEGRFKVFPFSSARWHDATVSPDGAGTFDISGPQTNYLPGANGPEGVVYVEAGASLFPRTSILVSEFNANVISSFEVDSNGDPIPGTRRVFMSGLNGAEGGTRDPVTGDFLFSTFNGGNRVLVVTGFEPLCEANHNGDCVVNTQDVIAFLNDWSAGDTRADFNEDGTVNTLDVIGFLNRWVAGC